MTKSLVVIGASSGIGRATGRLAAERGYQVVLAARRRRRLDALRTAIKKAGGVATAATCDVTDAGAVNRMLQRAAKRCGGIDAVVLTAGLGLAGSISGGRAQDWKRLLDTNVLGALNTARAAAPHLHRSRGDLVLISSVAALGGSSRGPAYGASKAGLLALMRYTAAEFGPRGIRCNAVLPGLIVVDRNRELWSGERLEQAEARIPLGRAGTPADVAAAVAFLASSDASAITGASLTVDGGASSGG